MKKIALLTKGFTGSLFPLAKQFLKKGYNVDIYIYYYKFFYDLEAFQCSYRSMRYGVEEIKSSEWPEMKNYLESVNCRLFSIKMPRPYNNIPVARKVMAMYSERYVKQTCLFLNKQNYDVINIIGGYYSKEYLPFLRKIKCKIVFSLHEVCNHFNPDFQKPSILLSYLFEKSIDIIIYSDNSFRDILRYKEVKKEKIHRLNFGLFETYMTIPLVKTLSLPEKYFLFFGSILPYKGLSILNDAIKIISNDIHDFKLVVAGKGNDPCLDELRNNPDVLIINKRLTNSELCQVITKSEFVICPYISMSQSGIPQTVYVFNKPIIASDLDGFKEIINHNHNGLLFKSGIAEELAACITKFIKNKDIYNDCVEGVKMFEKFYPMFTWQHIANKFIKKFL